MLLTYWLDTAARPGHVLLVLVAALLLDALVGGLGQARERGFGPRAWLGVVLRRLAGRWNTASYGADLRGRLGLVTWLIGLGLAAGVGFALEHILPYVGFAILGQGLAVLMLVLVLDQRAAFDRGRSFARALSSGDTRAARVAAAVIDRRPASQDRYGVARAGVETMARAFTRGVVGPALGYLLFGLAGALGYVAISELDRRFGYRTPAMADFGRFPARLDDIVTAVPARLAGGILAVAAMLVPTTAPMGALAEPIQARRAGAPLNLPWLLGGFAGALGVSLAGPFLRPDGTRVDLPWIGRGRSRATVRDVHRGIWLFAAACLVHLAVLSVLFAGLATL